MKTFKNKLFTKRDYECINVVFCQSEVAPSEHYEEIDENELLSSKCMELWSIDEKVGRVKYWGYM